MPSNPTVLLLAEEPIVAWVLPSVFARAGFEVDIITSSSILKSCKKARKIWLVDRKNLLTEANLQIDRLSYDWIIPTNDLLLQDIVGSALSPEKKLRLLPVLTPQNFQHLHSKIGLSQVLAKAEIRTPPFLIARNLHEAQEAALQLGFPVFIKIDVSSGGGGIFEYHDLASIRPDLFAQPVLVQKKIAGEERDISAIFREGQVIHFNYARPDKVCENPFGPSSVRTYFPLSLVDKPVFEEIAALGQALGANGFATISCIEAFDGSGRYFIEADMRPNVWTDFPRYFGEDPAERIRAWFSHKTTLTYPAAPGVIPAKPVKMAYFLRLSLFDILINRYAVWKFIPRDHSRVILALLIDIFFTRPWKNFQARTLHFIKESLFFPCVRALIPKILRAPLRKLFRKIVGEAQRT